MIHLRTRALYVILSGNLCSKLNRILGLRLQVQTSSYKINTALLQVRVWFFLSSMDTGVDFYIPFSFAHQKVEISCFFFNKNLIVKLRFQN
jgi:hypothetical protein